jgi:hypothetical protein
MKMAGPAALISVVSGAPQQAILGSAFAKPLVALVTDANGNPVSGVTVTFMPQGNGALCSFAGGVNTAVTNGSGIATSAAITANGTAGQYNVQAWVGTWPPASGAVGPANFWIMNSAPGPNSPGSLAAISAAWTTAKAHLATAQATLATLQGNLAACEGDCDALYAVGAGDVVDWLRRNLIQTLLGYQPRVSAGGNAAPQVLAVFAAQPGARDLSNVDQRPITSTPTGQYANLS